MIHFGFRVFGVKLAEIRILTVIVLLNRTYTSQILSILYACAESDNNKSLHNTKLVKQKLLLFLVVNLEQSLA